MTTIASKIHICRISVGCFIIEHTLVIFQRSDRGKPFCFWRKWPRGQSQKHPYYRKKVRLTFLLRSTSAYDEVLCIVTHNDAWEMAILTYSSGLPGAPVGVTTPGICSGTRRSINIRTITFHPAFVGPIHTSNTNGEKTVSCWLVRLVTPP